MPEKTIHIDAAGVDKTGEKNGKTWTRYFVQSGNDKYKTFDGALFNAANAAVGHDAHVVYEQGQYGFDLKFLEVVQGSTYTEPVQAAPPAKTADGDTDWDLIGLRKTRCALWVAVLSNNTLHVNDARQLVIAAEQDIFTRPPAQVEDEIPF